MLEQCHHSHVGHQPAGLVRTHLPQQHWDPVDRSHLALLAFKTPTSHPYPTPPHPTPGLLGSSLWGHFSVFSVEPHPTHGGLAGLCVGPLHLPLCVLRATASAHRQPCPRSRALGPPPFRTSPCVPCTNSQTEHFHSRTPYLPMFEEVKSMTPHGQASVCLVQCWPWCRWGAWWEYYTGNLKKK